MQSRQRPWQPPESRDAPRRNTLGEGSGEAAVQALPTCSQWVSLQLLLPLPPETSSVESLAAQCWADVFAFPTGSPIKP